MSSWVYENKTFKGYNIYKGYDDPMYNNDFYYIVCKYPGGRKGPDGKYVSPYMTTPKLNCYPYDDVDDDACIEVLKKYVAKYLPEDASDININSKDFQTIVLGSEYLNDIKHFFFNYE